MCSYCKNEHGAIGDVVCPILKRFPKGYTSKKVFNDTWPSTLEVDWPIEKYDFSKHSSIMTSGVNEEFLRSFKKYLDDLGGFFGHDPYIKEQYRKRKLKLQTDTSPETFSQ